MIDFLKIEIKSNLSKLYIACFLFMIFGFFIYGISNLTHDKVVQFIEIIFSVIGMITFTSLLNVDRNQSSLLVVNSKKYDYQYLFIIRIMLTIFYILLLAICSLVIFIFGYSEVRLFYDLFLSLSSAIYLGVICLILSQLTKNTLNGFMVGFSYFLVCLGFRNLGIFYLFPETFSFPTYIKILQFIIAIILIGLCIRLSKNTNDL